jgi:hypothetical protein
MFYALVIQRLSACTMSYTLECWLNFIAMIYHLCLILHWARSAKRNTEQFGFEYNDRLHLVKVNGERSQIVWSKEFLL